MAASKLSRTSCPMQTNRGIRRGEYSCSAQVATHERVATVKAVCSFDARLLYDATISSMTLMRIVCNHDRKRKTIKRRRRSDGNQSLDQHEQTQPVSSLKQLRQNNNEREPSGQEQGAEKRKRCKGDGRETQAHKKRKRIASDRATKRKKKAISRG